MSSLRRSYAHWLWLACSSSLFCLVMVSLLWHSSLLRVQRPRQFRMSGLMMRCSHFKCGARSGAVEVVLLKDCPMFADFPAQEVGPADGFLKLDECVV
jgi:hypothetical protein